VLDAIRASPSGGRDATNLDGVCARRRVGNKVWVGEGGVASGRTKELHEEKKERLELDARDRISCHERLRTRRDETLDAFVDFVGVSGVEFLGREGTATQWPRPAARRGSAAHAT
jgi:hypothetical protein